MQDDGHALAIARRIVANFNSIKARRVSTLPPAEPLYDTTELKGIIPSDPRKVCALWMFDVPLYVTWYVVSRMQPEIMCASIARLYILSY